MTFPIRPGNAKGFFFFFEETSIRLRNGARNVLLTTSAGYHPIRINLLLSPCLIPQPVRQITLEVRVTSQIQHLRKSLWR